VITDIIKRNNVHTFGRGTQPMLFAHGFGCDQNMWRFVTPAFEDEYRIVLFDYVGAGKSDVSAYNEARYSDLHGYAEDILDVCRALHLTDVILVGHSVSSITGILAANREPQWFQSIICVGPSPRYINDAGYIGGFDKQDITELLETMDKNYIGWANFLAPAVMQNSENPALAEELKQSFCSTDPRIARQFAEATFLSDNRKDLPHVRIPTLLLQCSNDIIAPVSVGEYMHAQMPRSTLKVMAATGHCPHMSAPNETIRLMKEFLAANIPAAR
jgi:sigma-B regulation protein RsbQ